MIDNIEYLKRPQKTILVIDYDRTLVTSTKKLLDETRKQLIKFQRNGGTIAIASGRPKSGLERIAIELQMPKFGGYIIGANGAEIYSYHTTDYLKKNYIDAIKLEHALKQLELIDISVGIYTDSKLLVNGYTSDLNDEATSNNLELVEKNLFLNLKSSPKIVLSKSRQTTHDYYDQICMRLSSKFNIVKSSPRYIEITTKQADKGLAIDRILKSNDSIEFVVGIGDSQNDLSMLEKSGLKIAMGNATDEVKLLADLVIESNENDGIGLFLSQL